MRIVWLRPASVDLEEIAAYIRRDKPRAAAKVFAAIKRQSKALADMPHLGRAGRVPGTRELALPPLPYILVYLVRENRIEILRVLHGAQLQ